MASFTSRIKILHVKCFAVIQNTLTHVFTTALHQPTYRHITTHTQTRQQHLLLRFIFDICGDIARQKTDA